MTTPTLRSSNIHIHCKTYSNTIIIIIGEHKENHLAKYKPLLVRINFVELPPNTKQPPCIAMKLGAYYIASAQWYISAAQRRSLGDHYKGSYLAATRHRPMVRSLKPLVCQNLKWHQWWKLSPNGNTTDKGILCSSWFHHFKCSTSNMHFTTITRIVQSKMPMLCHIHFSYRCFHFNFTNHTNFSTFSFL